jgi:hypothetical protein
MIELEAAYVTRPIRYLDQWQINQWRMKVYGIAYKQDEPQQELVQAARRTAEQRLTQSAEKTRHYGVGFVGIHQGKSGNFIFVDWWADENELHHHVYISAAEQATQLRYMTPTGITACTWDLKVIGFERDAWVETVLQAYPTPDVEAYLAKRLAGEF